MASIFTLKALGLNTMPNQLEAPEGSLTVANNVIINRDNVVESRRGYKIYGNSFGTSFDRAKQLLNYKQRIIRHYSDKLQFDNGSGIFKDFSGSYTETSPGLRIKSIETNGNLYFTTSEGIQKISAKDASEFTTSANYITKAGAIKAIDVSANVNYTFGDQSSFLTQDSAVAYRIAWGYRDANNNLFIGSPSQRVEVYNPLLNLMIQDFVKVLGALDNIGIGGSLINDQDYLNTLKLSISASPSELRNNLIILAEKIDNNILYADNDGAPSGAPLEIDNVSISSGICTITFDSGNPTDYFISGSKIFLSNFSPTSGSLDGAQIISTVTPTQITFNTTASGGVVLTAAETIKSNEYRSITQPISPNTPATNNDLVEIQTYLSNIISRLNQEPIAVISNLLNSEYILNLDITKASTVDLLISIPDDVNENYFYQIYRSAVFSAEQVLVLSLDVFPNDELQLVYEAYPTQEELDLGIIKIEDVVPDSFRGANLYTNPASGEGILQANDVPPLAKDINVFKNSIFYANTKTRHRKDISLIGVQNMIDDYNDGKIPTLTIATENYYNTYAFIIGEYEQYNIQTNSGATLASSGTASHFKLYTPGDSNYKTYYFWYKIGTVTDPTPSDAISVPIIADTLDTDQKIAERTRDVLNQFPVDFQASSSTNNITLIYQTPGYTKNIEDVSSGFIFTVTNEGIGERVAKEKTDISCVADISNSLSGVYFTLNSASNNHNYYIWFKTSGIGIDPAIPNKTGILVDLITDDTDAIVASKIKSVLDANFLNEFTTEISANVLTITNTKNGSCDDVTSGTSGFSINILQKGALQFLLSDDVSPARAVEQTSHSIVRVINRNDSELINAFYLSGSQEIPGKMLFEALNLTAAQFYLITNNSNTGDSFNPTFSPDLEISSISVGSPSTMVVTTSSPHGLTNLDTIIISGTDSSEKIDGIKQITYISPTQFSVNSTIKIAGTKGGVSLKNNVENSTNEEAKNRIYYSKYQQPEAVPILNYIDVGAKDKEILRIYPLRDSMFVFKEDGLYRISGEGSPFNLALFDSSYILLAPDSISSIENVIYGWSRQGISSVTESGVRNVSRPIDVNLLPLSSDNYPNFSWITWGIGYESDKTYTVFTNLQSSDITASIGFKYNSLTNTWTTIDKKYTCGIINNADDRMYVGISDTNYIEQERKSFTREDYADREYAFTLGNNRYVNNKLLLDSIENIDLYDVLIQEQTLTIYDFNMLLKKLDLDPGVSDTDYYSLLNASAGNNLRFKLLDLAEKLDLDGGVTETDYYSLVSDKSGSITAIEPGTLTINITSNNHGLINGRKVILSGTNSVPTINGEYVVSVVDANTFSVSIDNSVTTAGTAGLFITNNTDFEDLKSCYNKVISKLNLDSVVSFSNYISITNNTIQEVLITGLERVAKRIVLDQKLDLIAGDFTVFKSINCEIQYSPNSSGDPVSLKHFREAQLLFESLAFTKGSISFATDLLPKFEEVSFDGDGNGRFGFADFGSGFFGGTSHGAPIRTYIPRNSQRCRYMIVKFNHRVAREKFSLFGITITGDIVSTRAYK